MVHLKSKADKSFFGVAMSIVVIGAGLFGLGIAEWLLNYFTQYDFVYPMGKITAGVIVIALGYVVLELEWIRTAK
jgi:uncharacterized membrane protein YcjF (UPF0283 family)